MRSMTSGFQTLIEANDLRPCVLIKALFTSGTVALWSGYGDITYDGQVYQGAGYLLGISEVRETQTLEANGFTVSLSGIPSDMLSIALSEPYQGRRIVTYLGMMDSSGLISAVQISGAIMDVMTIEDNGTSATCAIQCEDDLVLLRKPVDAYLTPEDQKARYIDDKGLDFVPALQDKEITWGQGVQ